ncbi:MAG: hypothetical protein LBU32_16375 [Clostridiales bacterium]|jgi:hypothetical protein|nr:hypothetical protein [Clostridiales bacterium]
MAMEDGGAQFAACSEYGRAGGGLRHAALRGRTAGGEGRGAEHALQGFDKSSLQGVFLYVNPC